MVSGLVLPCKSQKRRIHHHGTRIRQTALRPALRSPGDVPEEHVRLDGRAYRRADGEDRRHEAGDLRRLQGGPRRAAFPQAKAGILVDEQFGADILRDAAKHGYVTSCPAEKSGQDEFDFEYGEDFARHIEAFRPTFCKVLVRYNPEGDAAMNRRQAGG